MHAGFRRRRIEDKLSLPVFLQYGIVMADHNRSIGIAIGRDPQPKNQEICTEQKQRRS